MSKGKGKIIVRMLEVSNTKERKMMGKKGFFEAQEMLLNYEIV